VLQGLKEQGGGRSAPHPEYGHDRVGNPLQDLHQRVGQKPDTVALRDEHQGLVERVADHVAVWPNLERTRGSSAWTIRAVCGKAGILGRLNCSIRQWKVLVKDCRNTAHNERVKGRTWCGSDYKYGAEWETNPGMKLKFTFKRAVESHGCPLVVSARPFLVQYNLRHLYTYLPATVYPFGQLLLVQLSVTQAGAPSP
jgi:hypothetical protein